MQGFLEFAEEKKITVKTKNGGEIPATIKVTGKDYHIVKADRSGKQYKVDHQGNSLEEEIDLDEAKTPAQKRDFQTMMAGGMSRDEYNKKHGLGKYAEKSGKSKVDPTGVYHNMIKGVKEETDKDLPFTPDKKKTKPSTPGKYGSAYSTVRNLARKALEKQAKKTVKEEVELQEAKSKQELQALMRKHEQHAIDANKRGDDAAAVKHQNYINSVKKKLENVVRNEEVELQEDTTQSHKVNVTVSDPNHTAISQRKEKIAKRVVVSAKDKGDALAKAKSFYQKKGYKVHDVEHHSVVPKTTMKTEETDLEESAEHKAAAEVHHNLLHGVMKHGTSAMTHNIKAIMKQHGATDYDKVKDLVRKKGYAGKFDEETDLEEGKKGYSPGWMLKADPELAKKVKANTQGYKDLKKYAGKDIPKKEVAEGYRGSSKADEPYWEAQEHKQAAEKAKKSGDQFSYHKFMSAHHDAMEHWSNNKGRTSVANLHAAKADEHEDYAQQARKGSK